MNYIELSTGDLMDEQAVRAAHPNTIFPRAFAPPDGYVPVVDDAAPSYNTLTHALQWSAPAQDAQGVWRRSASVHALPQAVADANVASARAMVWEAIKRERDHRSDSGGTRVGASWFHSDQRSKMQQVVLTMMGTNLPAGLQWKTMSGAFVTMTPTLAAQVFAAAAANEQSIFAAAEAHRAALYASLTPYDYDYSAGWPARFGDTP